MLRFLALAWTALLVVGCGSGGGSEGGLAGTSAGNAGTGSGGASAGGSGGSIASGGGAGAAGTGGAGGGPVATGSLRYACREYIRAACERREECTGQSLEGCLTVMDRCPDYLFSEGSSRTRESVLACAEVYRTQPCEEVTANRPPACATAGTLAPGSTCLFNSQCAGECNGQGSCGQCVSRAPEDGACGLDTGCQPWQYCDGSLCVDNGTTVEGDRLPGAACTLGCITGYVCARSSAAGESSCLPEPAAGQPCYYEAYDDGFGGNGQCGRYFYCDASFTCQPLPGQGEPCAPDLGGEPRCRAGACESGTCAVLDTPGVACSTSSSTACGGDTRCQCPTDEACAEGTCVYVREEAEGCTGQHDRCASGTVCSQGACVATDQLTAAVMCQ